MQYRRIQISVNDPRIPSVEISTHSCSQLIRTIGLRLDDYNLSLYFKSDFISKSCTVWSRSNGPGHWLRDCVIYCTKFIFRSSLSTRFSDGEKSLHCLLRWGKENNNEVVKHKLMGSWVISCCLWQHKIVTCCYCHAFRIKEDITLAACNWTDLTRSWQFTK